MGYFDDDIEKDNTTLREEGTGGAVHESEYYSKTEDSFKTTIEEILTSVEDTSIFKFRQVSSYDPNILANLNEIIGRIPSGQLRNYLEWLYSLEMTNEFQYNMLTMFFEFVDKLTNTLKEQRGLTDRQLKHELKKENVARLFEKSCIDYLQDLVFSSNNPEKILSGSQSMSRVIPGMTKLLKAKAKKQVTPKVTKGYELFSLGVKMDGYDDIVKLLESINNKTNEFITSDVPTLINKLVARSVVIERINETFIDIMSKNFFKDEKMFVEKYNIVVADASSHFIILSDAVNKLDSIANTSSVNSLRNIANKIDNALDSLKSIYSTNISNLISYLDIDIDKIYGYIDFIDSLSIDVSLFTSMISALDDYFVSYAKIREEISTSNLAEFMRKITAHVHSDPTIHLQTMNDSSERLLMRCESIIADSEILAEFFKNASEQTKQDFANIQQSLANNLTLIGMSFDTTVVATLKTVKDDIKNICKETKAIIDLYNQPFIRDLTSLSFKSGDASSMKNALFNQNVSDKKSDKEIMTTYTLSLTDEISNICRSLGVKKSSIDGLEQEIMNQVFSVSEIETKFYGISQSKYLSKFTGMFG